METRHHEINSPSSSSCSQGWEPFVRPVNVHRFEMDLAREVNGIVERREKKITTSSRLVGTSSSCVFTCLLHNNCTAVLGRQPKIVAKQTIIEAVAGGLIRLTVLSYMYNTQTILLAFPFITLKVFFHAQHFFRFIPRVIFHNVFAMKIEFFLASCFYDLWKKILETSRWNLIFNHAIFCKRW